MDALLNHGKAIAYTITPNFLSKFTDLCSYASVPKTNLFATFENLCPRMFSSTIFCNLWKSSSLNVFKNNIFQSPFATSFKGAAEDGDSSTSPSPWWDSQRQGGHFGSSLLVSGPNGYPISACYPVLFLLPDLTQFSFENHRVAGNPKYGITRYLGIPDISVNPKYRIFP